MDIRRMLVMLVAVLPAAGCSSDPTPAPYLTQPSIACPPVDALTRQRSSEPLPAGFRAASAMRCTFRPAIAQPHSSFSSSLEWVAAYRSVGPFDELVRALHLPPQKPASKVVCPANFVTPVLVALTDVSGHTLVPAVPGTACRAPRLEVSSALQALPWTEIARAR